MAVDPKLAAKLFVDANGRPSLHWFQTAKEVNEALLDNTQLQCSMCHSVEGCTPQETGEAITHDLWLPLCTILSSARRSPPPEVQGDNKEDIIGVSCLLKFALLQATQRETPHSHSQILS